MSRALSAFAGCVLGTALLLTGCSVLDHDAKPAAAASRAATLQPAPGEFSVMSFNLYRYQLQTPPASAEGLDPVAPPSADDIIQAICSVSPDILAIQEMGDPASWTDFKFRLRKAGLEYRYEEYLQADGSEINLALLSRFPVTDRTLHTSDTYTIGPTKFPVQRGFIEAEVAVTPDYRLRLFNAHIKSKQFHEYGQAEMRRNESRLLGNHVRRALADDKSINVLVLGTLNDEPGSRSLREIYAYQGKEILTDIRPADSNGDAWTQRLGNDSHTRSDYLLVSSGLLSELVLDKTFIPDTGSRLLATDHRPLVATFVSTDLPRDQAPGMESRKPIAYSSNN